MVLTRSKERKREEKRGKERKREERRRFFREGKQERGSEDKRGLRGCFKRVRVVKNQAKRLTMMRIMAK
jgi:hypothetical protein